MAPLTAQQFTDALRKGLGRAFLHVREHGAAGMPEALLDACLHDLSYDPQCEESRADWLMLLLEESGSLHVYRERIVSALPALTGYWDIRQGLQLALRFARRGDQAARDGLYRFAASRYDRRRVGLSEVVELDGVQGLLHVAAVLGDQYRQDPETWDSASWWVSDTCERLGQDRVWSALRAEAARDARIASFLEAMRTEEAELDGISAAAGPSPSPTMDDVTCMIDDPSDAVHLGHMTRFGRAMTGREAELFFDRLLAETRPIQLARYLALFRDRGFPSLPPRVFELALSSDEEVRWAAFQALGKCRSPEVRRFARALLGREPSAAANGAILLFEHNYEPEDAMLFESVLERPQEPEQAHPLGSALLRVGAAGGGPELASCLLWVCEQTPCTLCRRESVEALVKWSRAPKPLLAECHWDADARIREIARSALPLCRTCGRELPTSGGLPSDLGVGLAYGADLTSPALDMTLCVECQRKAMESG